MYDSVTFVSAKRGEEAGGGGSELSKERGTG